MSSLLSLHRRLRRSVASILLMALLGVVLVNLLCVWAARLLASEGFWLDNPAWKGLLLDLQSPAPDVVLVGSSRVQNHFDTRLMSQSGRSYFNYGIPGLLADEMRPLVERAAERAGSTVVISLPVQTLFSPTHCPNTWGWADVRFSVSHSPQCLWTLSANDWFKLLPINELLVMATPDVKLLPCRREGLGDELRRIGDMIGGSPCDDPRHPILMRGSFERRVLIYANGDGVIVPARLDAWQARVTWTDYRQQAYDVGRLEQLRSLLDTVRKHGKQPVLLIESGVLRPFYIRQDIAQVLGVRTFYLNEWTFADDEIADADHLNRKGGLRVSVYLAEQLKSLSVEP